MKALLKIVVVLLLLVVGGAVYLYTNLDRAVKGAVEEFGPRYTGTPVTLGSVNLSPLSGEGSLGNLAVGNPEGFTSLNAFTLGRVDIAVDTQSLNSDTIIVDTLQFVAPEIIYETSGSTNNLKLLQKNLERVVGSGDEDDSSSASEESARKIIIRHFAVTGGKVHYAHQVLGDQTLQVELPALELNGIGEKAGGVTAVEATRQIVVAINRQASRAVANSDAVRELGKQYEDQFNEKKEQLKSQFEGLKGIFGK